MGETRIDPAAHYLLFVMREGRETRNASKAARERNIAEPA